MTLTPLVVVGGGGFGRQVLDIVDAINAVRQTWDLLGVLDDGPSDANSARLKARGVPHLGSTRDGLAVVPADCHYCPAVASPQVRRRLSDQCDAAGLQPATLVHPGATIGSLPVIGDGSVVCAGAQLSTNIVLGRHVHITPNSTIGHDCVLHEHTTISPGATISGDCTLGARTFVGAAAVILQGLTTGADSVVGAAACVIRDVPAGQTVVGVPARPYRSRVADPDA